MNYKLINFNIPLHLKEQLDHIAMHKHISRTAILNLLIDRYCQQEFVLIDSKQSNEYGQTSKDKRLALRQSVPLAPVFTNTDYDPFYLEDL